MPHSSYEILIAVLNGNSRISKALEHSLAPVHGLGLNEFLALYHLTSSNNPMSRISLAEQLGLSASGVTRLLSPMEKLGLIERQTNTRDARLSLVKVSDAGALKFNEANHTVEETVTRLLSNVTEDEKVTLLSLISKIG